MCGWLVPAGRSWPSDPVGGQGFVGGRRHRARRARQRGLPEACPHGGDPRICRQARRQAVRQAARHFASSRRTRPCRAPRAASQGRGSVRLCRGGEEALTLVEHGVPFRIVPGITAGIGGLAYAGIPVTHREVNHAVTFLTGHDSSGVVPDRIDWEAIGRGSPVIVMYMAMKHMGQIATNLMAAGRRADEPVAFVCNAATPEQMVLETTLGRAKSTCSRPASNHCHRGHRRGRASAAFSRLARCAFGPQAFARPLCRRSERLGMSGLLIAAPASGSGKTVVTLG